MPLLLKTSIKRAFAESFLTEIAANRANHYLFIAKTTPWPETAGASADVIPVVPADTVRAEYDVMRSIIGYKQIDPSKIVFALPRIGWSAGSVYDVYRDDVELFNPDAPSNFYVVTDANNIYKCVGATAGTARTISKSTGTVNALYLNVQDSTASGGAKWYANSSNDLGNNTGWNIFNNSFLQVF
jgi:hypothetical protein